MRSTVRSLVRVPPVSEPKGKAGADAPTRELPRRFYENVDVVATGGGHGITLDGRPVSTPKRARLVVPWVVLAEEIAAEWSGQGEHILPETMPLTRLVNSALDGVARARSETVDDIVKFAASDLLFYRAEGPEALVIRQTAVWDPIVAWAGGLAGGRFLLTEGVIHVAQPEALLGVLRREVERRDNLALAALHTATTLTGSALLGLAVALGELAAEDAWTAAHVDEDWQMSQWGEDTEAMERRNRRARDFMAAAGVLDIARTDSA